MSYKCGDRAPGLPAPARIRANTVTEGLSPGSTNSSALPSPADQETTGLGPNTSDAAVGSPRLRRPSGANVLVTNGFRPISDFQTTKANLLSWQIPEDESTELHNDIIQLKGGSCRGLGVVCAH